MANSKILSLIASSPTGGGLGNCSFGNMGGLRKGGSSSVKREETNSVIDLATVVDFLSSWKSMFDGAVPEGKAFNFGKLVKISRSEDALHSEKRIGCSCLICCFARLFLITEAAVEEDKKDICRMYLPVPVLQIILPRPVLFLNNSRDDFARLHYLEREYKEIDIELHDDSIIGSHPESGWIITLHFQGSIACLDISRRRWDVIMRLPVEESIPENGILAVTDGLWNFLVLVPLEDGTLKVYHLSVTEDLVVVHQPKICRTHRFYTNVILMEDVLYGINRYIGRFYAVKVSDWDNIPSAIDDDAEYAVIGFQDFTCLVPSFGHTLLIVGCTNEIYRVWKVSNGNTELSPVANFKPYILCVCPQGIGLMVLSKPGQQSGVIFTATYHNMQLGWLEYKFAELEPVVCFLACDYPPVHKCVCKSAWLITI